MSKTTIACLDCKDEGILSDGSGCQQCCEHSETDHDICLDCSYEIDPGLAIDAAMDYVQGDR